MSPPTLVPTMRSKSSKSDIVKITKMLVYSNSGKTSHATTIKHQYAPWLLVRWGSCGWCWCQLWSALHFCSCPAGPPVVTTCMSIGQIQFQHSPQNTSPHNRDRSHLPLLSAQKPPWHLYPLAMEAPMGGTGGTAQPSDCNNNQDKGNS